MSTIRSVGFVAITVIPPAAPAGTIAIFAVTAPVGAFNVEEPGWEDPAGQALRNPSGPDGTTVMLKAYAWALAGIPQGPDSTGNVRETLAARAGPAKEPVPIRVSARRQRVIG